MALNWRKIFFPTASDLFAPHMDMKRLADSVSTITQVSGKAERDALLPAGGLVFGVNTPIYVHRLDTVMFERWNGTDWVKFAGPLSVVESDAWSSALIDPLITNPAAAVELISVPIVVDTTADVRIDVDLDLQADGNAHCYVDLYVDDTLVRRRQAHSNLGKVLDGSLRKRVRITAGSHTVKVKAVSANTTSNPMRFLTGMVSVEW